ncbi:hypothetical protein F511_30642 [Dorcoceras hygrometricum]|uniref:Uncharacterized protein n=1 Tax=Dorcoceras hygrometricum TaxID=472368 RepID=A0A2Z7AH58_9LAMI|nr:hypothetical protein F511_30642 [Dorcoceras hygrometricum]
MASSLSINAMQVNFESVLTMEHTGMVRLFKSLEETGLKGFLEFMAPNKKKEMKVEYRLLHDIVTKALCAKAGSLDVVTSEKFDSVVSISAGLKETEAEEEHQAPEHRAQEDEHPAQGDDHQAHEKQDPKEPSQHEEQAVERRA